MRLKKNSNDRGGFINISSSVKKLSVRALLKNLGDNNNFKFVVIQENIYGGTRVGA